MRNYVMFGVKELMLFFSFSKLSPLTDDEGLGEPKGIHEEGSEAPVVLDKTTTPPCYHW